MTIYDRLITDISINTIISIMNTDTIKFDIKSERIKEFASSIPRFIAMFSKSLYADRFDKLLRCLCVDPNMVFSIKDNFLISETLAMVNRLVLNNQRSYSDTLLLIDWFNSLMSIARKHSLNWLTYLSENTKTFLTLLEACLGLPHDAAPLSLLKLSLVLDEDENSSSAMVELSTKIARDFCAHNRSIEDISMRSLNKFIENSLLDNCNSKSHRHHAHTVVYKLLKLADIDDKKMISDYLWSILPKFVCRGEKSYELFALLAYATANIGMVNADKMAMIVEMLKSTNQDVINNSNHGTYKSLLGLINVEGYYLEKHPCQICYQPELPFTTNKLADLQLDMKSTSMSQIVKLKTSQSISGITLLISEFKRIKMCKTIAFYYNLRSDCILDLKNKPGEWIRVKQVILSPAQTEVKLVLPYPIVARNLMIEYIDFYDNANVTSLLCPRCSSIVVSNMGTCNICNEVIYQCNKCRGINYDNRFPFLCQNCGYCKYAKFEFSVTSRPSIGCCAIHSDTERRNVSDSVDKCLTSIDERYRDLELARRGVVGALDMVANGNSDRIEKVLYTSDKSQAVCDLAKVYGTTCKDIHEDITSSLLRITEYREEILRFTRSKGTKHSQPTSPHQPTVQKRVSAVKCYSCSYSVVKHLVQLLVCCSMNSDLATILGQTDLLEELLTVNLKESGFQIIKSVELLVHLLITNNPKATSKFHKIICERIATAAFNDLDLKDVDIASDISLLLSTMTINDNCWRMRIKCGLMLISTVECLDSIRVITKIIVPIVQLMFTFNMADHPKVATTMLVTDFNSLSSWLQHEDDYSQFLSRVIDNKINENETSDKNDLIKDVKDSGDNEKVAICELQNVKKRCVPKILNGKFAFNKTHWLAHAMIQTPEALDRFSVNKLLSDFSNFTETPSDFQYPLLDLLASFIPNLVCSTDLSRCYTNLFINTINTKEEYKQYLVEKGALTEIKTLIVQEVNALMVAEENCLTLDLNVGCSIEALAQLLDVFMSSPEICKANREFILPVVLDSYLMLSRIFACRSKFTIESERMFHKLLISMTSSSKENQIKFMKVCVLSSIKYPDDDYNSPAFLFEKISNIICPKSCESVSFSVSFTKDPDQEEYLTGGMGNNPYDLSTLGPYMRDLKNKICVDTELLALIDDDNGMELIVENKIISLQLKVIDVYLNLWCKHHRETEPMLITYRIRGLNGDAQEDTIESFNQNTIPVDIESVFKLASTLAEDESLSIILERFAKIDDWSHGTHLMEVCMRLLNYCSKLKVNRDIFMSSPRTMEIMTAALNLSLLHEAPILNKPILGTKKTFLSEDILEFMFRNLENYDGNNQDESWHQSDSKHLSLLLDRVMNLTLQNNVGIFDMVVSLVPCLTFGDPSKISLIVDRYRPYLQFDLNNEANAVQGLRHRMSFSVIVNSESDSDAGHSFRNHVFETNLTNDLITSLIRYAPNTKRIVAMASEKWLKFTEKHSLPLIIKILHGLSLNHEATQILIGERAFDVLHYLEQLSSASNISVLCEELLTSFNKNQEIIDIVKSGRENSTKELKRLSKMNRDNYLASIGMKTNAKGQVLSNKNHALLVESSMMEETGLACSICHEGYGLQPDNILSIYTLTKKVTLGQFDNSVIKRSGYFSVSHFVAIHNECHDKAVAVAKNSARSEWTSATLHNSNTKCNSMLPVWAGNITEKQYSLAIVKYHKNISESATRTEFSYSNSLHALRILIHKISIGESLSVDSGGGGASSNLNTVPYWISYILYLMQIGISPNVLIKEVLDLDHFVTSSKAQVITATYQLANPQYMLLLSLFTKPCDWWIKNRVQLLKKLILSDHTRNTSKTPINLTSDTIYEYEVYKGAWTYFAIVNAITLWFKKTDLGDDGVVKGKLKFMKMQKDFLDKTEIITELLEYQLSKIDNFEAMYSILNMDIDRKFMEKLLKS